MAKQVDIIGDAFGLFEAIYAFQSVSIICHAVFINIQNAEVETLSIPQQSDTRWVCKFAGVQFFRKRFKCVVSTLSTLIQSRNRKEAAEALGLPKQYIVCLKILVDVLGITSVLSLQLQSRKLDLGSCTRLIEACIKTIQSKRTDTYFDQAWDETVMTAAQYSLDIPNESSKRKLKLRHFEKLL